MFQRLSVHPCSEDIVYFTLRQDCTSVNESQRIAMRGSRKGWDTLREGVKGTGDSSCCSSWSRWRCSCKRSSALRETFSGIGMASDAHAAPHSRSTSCTPASVLSTRLSWYLKGCREVLRACESFMSCSVQGGCLGTSHRHDSAKSLTIKRRISQRIRDVQGQATLVWVERLAAYLAHAKIVFGSQHDTGQAVVCRQRD